MEQMKIKEMQTNTSLNFEDSYRSHAFFWPYDLERANAKIKYFLEKISIHTHITRIF